MPAIQYTPIRFRRGKAVHASCLYDLDKTPCGKVIRNRGVRIVDAQLNCAGCMAGIVAARKRAHRKSSKNAVK